MFLKHIKFLIIIMVTILTFGGNTDANIDNIDFVNNSCDQTLWNYTWGENLDHSWRLKLNSTTPCISVTGTIRYTNIEHDGDMHIGLKLDNQYNFLLNQNNINAGGGDLIIEIICSDLSNADSKARAACGNFRQSFPISVNEHVKVTGQYVTDLAGAGWNEIHPITSIEFSSNVKPTPIITPTPTDTPNSTNTPLPTPTPTPTDPPLPTPTPTPTDPPLPTPTPTPTDTPNSTNTPLHTPTPTPTDTPNSTNTPLHTPTPTDTPTPTITSIIINYPRGGGGGGSDGSVSGSGITSSEPYNNIYKSEEKDEYVSKLPFTYKFVGVLPIYEISIKDHKNDDIDLKIELLKNTSLLVNDSAPGDVYENFNMWINSKRINNLSIKYKIENSWLNTGQNEIKLFGWNNNNKEWKELETNITRKDNSFTYFDSNSGGLSIFAISRIKTQEQFDVKPELPVVTTVNITDIHGVSTTETPTPKKSPGLEIITIVIVLIIYVFVKRR